MIIWLSDYLTIFWLSDYLIIWLSDYPVSEYLSIWYLIIWLSDYLMIWLSDYLLTMDNVSSKYNVKWYNMIDDNNRKNERSHGPWHHGNWGMTILNRDNDRQWHDRTINFILKNTCYTVYKSLNLEIMLMIWVFEHLPALTPPNPPTQTAPQASSQANLSASLPTKSRNFTEQNKQNSNLPEQSISPKK